MKRYSVIIALLIFFSHISDAQKTNRGTQEEQESYQAKQVFKKEYAKQKFDRFTGEVKRNGDGFSFGNKTFVVVNTEQNLIPIFSKGLFYPQIISGYEEPILKTQSELDSLSQDQRLFYNMGRTDSMTISNLEELPFLNKGNSKKRFRFWLFRIGMANPTVCFIELTNERANKKTDLSTFIEGARLTFFKRGGLVI